MVILAYSFVNINLFRGRGLDNGVFSLCRISQKLCRHTVLRPNTITFCIIISFMNDFLNIYKLLDFFLAIFCAGLCKLVRISLFFRQIYLHFNLLHMFFGLRKLHHFPCLQLVVHIFHRLFHSHFVHEAQGFRKILQNFYIAPPSNKHHYSHICFYLHKTIFRDFYMPYAVIFVIPLETRHVI